MIRFPFNWYNKFGTIPSEYREAMSYEEQILWLCEQIDNLKAQTGNFNYSLLINKPQINGVTLEGNLTSGQLGINTSYLALSDKPQINAVTLTGNKSLDDLGIQGKLIAGSGIRIVGNTISTTGGGGGGTSDYEDLDNKPSINGEVLLGDSSSYNLKLQNMLVTDLTYILDEHKGVVADVSFWQLGHVLPYETPETDAPNSSYVELMTYKGERVNFSGICDLYKFNEDNTLTYTYSTNLEYDDSYIDIGENGKVIINYWTINTYTPKFEKIASGESIDGEREEVKKDVKALDIDFAQFLEQNFPYQEYPLTSFSTGHYFAISESNIGEVLPASSEDATAIYTKMPIYTQTLLEKTRNFASYWALKGKASMLPMYFTTKEEGGIEYISSVSKLNLDYESNEAIFVDFPEDATYLYFQFNQTNSLTPELYYQAIGSLDAGVEVRKLDSNIVLLASTEITAYDSGFYQTTASGKLYYHNTSADNLILEADEMFYFDKTEQLFILENRTYAYDSGHNDWTIFEHNNITNTLLNSRYKIPTSQAVYDALGHDIFYTTLDADITFNMDGTNDQDLDTGYYFTKMVYYYEDNTSAVAYSLCNALCYYNSSTNNFHLVAVNPSFYFDGNLTYIDSTNGWAYTQKTYNDVLKTTNIATSISSGSTNNEVASALAVYNATSVKQNQVTYSTTDLTAGTSPLTTGDIYLVYET